ncbi:hypothetical protein FZZ93_05915 [Halomonas eurihalina]|uniref:Lipoprotein n=1 Tax=Halomonas eurihalina TaxID=42566 RepID=A0A5D9DBT6_HALER|nr:hypothetical protein [Halomonas eurihalina]MDR5859380.1 hypothetical protein [Halomonas eurihalina]TZG40580.1 hypothetical protein FZZ93_05915 [Halomonas eurihalina]
MNGWHRVMASIMLSLLAGCGNGEEQGNDSAERLGGVAQPEEERDTEPASELEPFDQDVALGVSVRLDETSRLRVEGTTNLPPDTRLRVMAQRNASGVSWRESVVVEEGGFAAGPFGPGSGLPEGAYRIRVTMPPISVQPVSVQSRLGRQGEHLGGPLVVGTKHGQGRVIEAQWSLRIVPGVGVQMSP